MDRLSAAWLVSTMASVGLLAAGIATVQPLLVVTGALAGVLAGAVARTGRDSRPQRASTTSGPPPSRPGVARGGPRCHPEAELRP